MKNNTSKLAAALLDTSYSDESVIAIGKAAGIGVSCAIGGDATRDDKPYLTRHYGELVIVYRRNGRSRGALAEAKKKLSSLCPAVFWRPKYNGGWTGAYRVRVKFEPTEELLQKLR